METRNRQEIRNLRRVLTSNLISVSANKIRGQISVILAAVAILPLFLCTAIPASDSDWITVQDGQFYLDGEPFFPIGSSFYYNEEVFRQRVERGVNIFSVPALWFDFPENEETRRQEAEFEECFRMAEKHGVHLLVLLFLANRYHWPFAGTPAPFDKGQTVFNASQGGPCSKPEDVLTHPESIELMKARIRKVVDRWGDSPAIFAWDVMSEMDMMPNPEEEQAAWVKEIGGYINGNFDYWSKLVTP